VTLAEEGVWEESGSTHSDGGWQERTRKRGKSQKEKPRTGVCTDVCTCAQFIFNEMEHQRCTAPLAFMCICTYEIKTKEKPT